VTSLDGSFAKLDRADKHIQTLYEKVQRWGSQKPYSFTYEDNSEKTERRYDIVIEQAPNLLRWGVFVGDAVHNLRSALDHIAWQCAGGDGVAPDWTECPVFKDRDDFLKTGRGGGSNKIVGITDPRHRTLMEEFQPWHNPNGYEGDELWILHEFNRIDKHRVLTPILFVPLKVKGITRVTYATPEEAEDASPPLIVAPPQRSLYNGAEVFRVICSLPFVDMEMNTHLDVGIALEYGDARLGNIYRGGTNFVLTKLAKRVRGIAEQFRDTGI
jgi:hypothetical protein